MDPADFAAEQQQMLLEIAAHAALVHQTTGKSALDPRVMQTFAKVPRHAFVPAELRAYAYLDQPLPIGYGKTISQPFIAALMTDLLDLKPEDRVLEIGTGLGFQAAVLAGLVERVFTIEIIEELAEQAVARLGEAGCERVEVKIGNGYHGWPERAPFDKIIVTAAPQLVPAPLLGQLKAGGRMVIPVGLPESQTLALVQKNSDGRISIKEILRVRFSALEEEVEP